ncbi:hypothetical protein [Amycolatopsis nigrescens]|uniref:hypothetical protein n=1 Tax=Amycolatopsis nigrescens TaxID=381445 RepID=UPI00039F2012|nr:hypothetical protein [Amycolatopsis nigrescens]
MSYSHAVPGQAAPPIPLAAPPKRPGVLIALLVAAIGSAVAAVAGAVMVFTGGRELAATNLTEALDKLGPSMGMPDGFSAQDIAELSGSIWDTLVDERLSTLTARGGFALFFAAWLLIFGLCALKGATWARVLITIGAVLSVVPHFLILADYEPNSVVVTSLAALLLGLVAVVLCWLPPINRYQRALKAPR